MIGNRLRTGVYNIIYYYTDTNNSLRDHAGEQYQ